jgi:hypothetical protein
MARQKLRHPRSLDDADVVITWDKYAGVYRLHWAVDYNDYDEDDVVERVWR